MPNLGPSWSNDGDEAARLASSVALATFALTDKCVQVDHRKRLLNEAIWFVTERGSVSRKYLLRPSLGDAACGAGGGLSLEWAAQGRTRSDAKLIGLASRHVRAAGILCSP